jgi:membrane dipeptidase
MHWTDAHLDLAYLAVSGRDLRQPVRMHKQGCISLPELRAGSVDLIFATIYTEPAGASSGEPWQYPSSDDIDAAEGVGLRQLAIYEQLEAEGEVTIVRTQQDLKRDAPKPKVILLMEGADPIRSPEALEMWFGRGLRMVGLTWSMGTRYAGGNARPGPLTALGVELVHAMNECNMVHDVSHLADDAFDSVLEHARSPVIATHSNCRSILDSDKQRHLTDDQIARLAQRGGVIGLNLFSKFLVREGQATVADSIAHIEHICSIMGHRRGVGLGSDMDGGFTPRDLPSDLSHPTQLGILIDALQSRGWSPDEVAGFMNGNWNSVLERALPES